MWAAQVTQRAVATDPSGRRGTRALLLTATLATTCVAGCARTEGSACNAVASGSTAIAAARSFVADCGSDFRIARGPYDAHKESGAYAKYAQVAEFEISVANSPKGPAGFLLVGRRTRHGPWRTLAPLATGP